MRRIGHKTKSRKRGSKTGHSELLYGTVSNRSLPNSELQKGFTLIEIIIVIVILSIISAITIKFLVDSLRIYTMTVNQKTLLDEGKLALERMRRDIRDAQAVTSVLSNSITVTRTNATAQDGANESITFRLNGSTLQKVKTSPAATSDLASNVSTFAVTNTSNEITLQLTLLLGSGENVTLQTKVYLKNLGDSSTYKNFGVPDSGGAFTSWQEVSS